MYRGDGAIRLLRHAHRSPGNDCVFQVYYRYHDHPTLRPVRTRCWEELDSLLQHFEEWPPDDVRVEPLLF